MSDEVDHMVERVHRMMELLQQGEIVSSEIGLLKIGATSAFQVEALVPTDRQIMIFTYFYPDKVESELQIYRYTSANDFHFVLKDPLKALRTIPEALQVCGEIRAAIEGGLSYMDAISPYKL